MERISSLRGTVSGERPYARRGRHQHREFAGTETLDSAGGQNRIRGDYIWSNQRLPYSQSDQSEYLLVLATGDVRVLPLSKAAGDSQHRAYLVQHHVAGHKVTVTHLQPSYSEKKEIP